MLETFQTFFREYISGEMYFPRVRVIDIVEIIIIAFLIYQIILWIKNTKAWMLLKGMLVLGGFILAAYIFKMYTILWSRKDASGYGDGSCDYFSAGTQART